MIIRSIYVVAAALTTAALSHAAVAVPGTSDVPSVVVRTSDLDLASDRGAKILRNRVIYAAHAVCGDADPRDISAMRPVLACRKDAIAHAMPRAQVAIDTARKVDAYAANDIQLTALHH